MKPFVRFAQSWAWVGALTISLGFLGLLVLERPNFLVSADTLLPAALIWDIQHYPAHWASFQQARVPSFFPDLAIYGPLQAISGSWRLAMAIWVNVVLVSLAVLTATIVTRLSRVTWAAACASVLIFILPLLTVASFEVAGLTTTKALGDAGLFPYLLILLPFTHGGPFLLALAAALLADPSQGGRLVSRTIGLGLLSWCGAISDLLVMTSLLIPLTLALGSNFAQRRTSGSHLLALGGAAWLGGGAGWASAALLNRQPTPFPHWVDLPRHLQHFATDLIHHPVMIAALLGLVVAVAADLGFRGSSRWLASFWSIFGASSALAALLATGILYEDMWSYRYALPFLWWPIILSAPHLARVLTARRFVLRGATVAYPAFMAALVAMPGNASTLLTWRSPLASCLSKADLHSGLAEYWVARPISASSNWHIQVEQITPNGGAYIWGNDKSWFTQDRHHPNEPPPYNFIVMDRLDRTRIMTVYGELDRRLSCGASSVWIYDRPGGVYRHLLRASADLAPRTSAVALQ